MTLIKQLIALIAVSAAMLLASVTHAAHQEVGETLLRPAATMIVDAEISPGA